MDGLAAVFAAATSVVAVVLGFLSFRREQNVRREQIEDRRLAQARLITAWWTRVSKDTGEDLSPIRNTAGPAWPAEAGYRVWISNSSDDAVHDCFVEAPIEPAPELAAELAKDRLVSRPYMVLSGKNLRINIGTLPPRERTPYLLGPELVRSVGKLTVHFRDSGGRVWRRTAGELVEDTDASGPVRDHSNRRRHR